MREGEGKDEIRTATRILFVCLGNICRSPMAEGAMRRVAERRGLDLEIDSAGIGDWHIGKPPDPRAIATAMADGVDIGGQLARKLSVEDFARFDLLCVMDAANRAEVESLVPPGSTARVRLFRDCVPGNRNAELADPYFGAEVGFELSWRQAVEAAEALADRLDSQADTPSARKSTSGS